MPNMETIRKTAERRAARAQRTDDNKVAAVEQEHTLAALQERLQRVKTGTATDEDNEEIARATPPVRKTVSRQEARVQAQINATAQAEQDAQRTVAPLTEEAIDLSYYSSRGLDVPLHVLNQIAKQADRQLRDESRDAAQAAGKVVFDTLTGRRAESSRLSRQKHVAETMTQIARQPKPAATTE